MFKDPSIGRIGLTGDVEADRNRLRGLLGRLPDACEPVTATLRGIEDKGPYLLETIVLNLNGIEAVPAYFTKPKGPVPPGGFPAVVYNHSHGGNYGVGKTELLKSAPYMLERPYAEELASQGIAVLAIDHWAFGERATVAEGALFKDMLWRGMVLWGMMVYDSLRAVDYLVQRPDVDGARLGTLGMSMGSSMAWWLAALDERIQVCVDICCLTDFDELLKEGGLDLHGIYYYVPDLLTNFSTTDINALICPRPHLGLAGTLDGLTPVAGLQRIDEGLRAIYSEAGAPGDWQMLCCEVAHQETPSMREAAVEFLVRHLGSHPERAQ